MKMSVYIIMPTCVCNAKVWIDFSIGVSFVIGNCIIECNYTLTGLGSERESNEELKVNWYFSSD